ncbi:MAG: PEP-CTERM sorting domain-containing protein [Chitinophagaceae bacterium]|nr:PEP-CTERM sorting domain-containing protein [Rubrivivax sp.]
MMPRLTPSIVHALLLCLCPGVSHAATAAMPELPAARVIGTVLLNRGDRIDTGTLGSVAVSDPRLGSATLSVLGTPLSIVQASASAGPSADLALLFNRGVGILSFGFAIDGPTSTVPVLIDVLGSAMGAASAGASFAVLAGWELYSSPSQTQLLATDLVQSGQVSGTFAQGFQRTVPLTLNTQQVYWVVLRADAGAAASKLGSSAQASSFVDPLFRTGAGVDGDLYDFVFSAGIGNQPVPEPAAVLLTGLGLGMLALRMRRSASPAQRR